MGLEENTKLDCSDADSSASCKCSTAPVAVGSMM